MLLVKRSSLAIHLFGFLLLSTFIPVKIYPVIFILVCSLFFSRTVSRTKIGMWVYFILLLSSLILTNFLSFRIDSDVLVALFKYSIGVSLLVGVVFCRDFRNMGETGLKLLGYYLNIVVVLLFIQMAYLQISFGKITFSSESSATASYLFDSSKIFFGVDDKNIFGAKCALYGYLATVVYYLRYRSFSKLLAFISFFSCALTLSRTSIMFYVLSFFIFWIGVKIDDGKKNLVYFIIILISIGLLFLVPLLESYLRFSSIVNLEHGDGMSLRLIYWLTLFQHVIDIPAIGCGILSGAYFLGRYSPYYNGEPNLHNLFLNNYLDLGWIGFLLYLLFFITYIRFLNSILTHPKIGLLLCIPVFMIMNTLYTAYDNDLWVYFSLSYLIAIFTCNMHHVEKSTQVRFSS